MGRSKSTKPKPERHICPKPKGCGRDFPFIEKYFHKNGQQKWGLHVYCKECRNKHKRQMYKRQATLKEIENEKNKRWSTS